MKIVFSIGSLSGGGAERVVARIASRMAELGHQVTILLIASQEVGYKIDNRVNIKYVCTSNTIKGVRFVSRIINYRKTIKNLAPDIVLSFTVGVNMFVLVSLLGLKQLTIISERNDPYSDPKSKKMRRLRNWLYRLADGIVFQTSDAQNYFFEHNLQESTIIINPIDNNIPSPYLGEKSNLIVSVGRLEPQKNHRLLIDAFSEIAYKLPEYKLLIFGKGSMESELKKQISEKGMNENILLMGYKDNVLEEIRNAKMFILSSDYEGISNALLEAMAIGLPVISTDHPIGGARQLIKNGHNGLLVNVGDKNELKNAILRLVEDPVLLSQFEREAVKVRQIADIDIVVKKWLDFIQHVITIENIKKN